MADFPSDDRILLSAAVQALSEATQTMARVAAAAAEQHQWAKGHEALCELREKASQKSLDSMVAAVQRLADTVDRNAKTASDDRAALSKRIQEEREERRKEIREDKAASGRFLRWVIGTILFAVSVATAVIVATRGAGP